MKLFHLLIVFGWLSYIKIIAQLDALALQCRVHLIAAGHLLDVENMNGNSLSGICTNICAFMRSQGFDAAERESHYRI